MSARAIWKGTLAVDDQRVPVKLYSAVEDRTVRFHMLELKTQSRVQQRMLDIETGKEVPREQIGKGYKFEHGRFVLLTDEELQAVAPKESRDLVVTRFVPIGAVEHLWYQRPYYLGPDEGSATGYFSLAAALQKSQREGIVQWTMRKRLYLGSLRSEDGYLMLIALRFAQEVVSVADLPKATGRAADAREIKMASQLVDALEGKFDPAEYHDEYQDRLLKFITAKAQGQRPKLQIVARKKPVESLVDSLAASLKAVGGRKEHAHARSA